jgi:PAS domain S-box-containing protein
MDSFTDAHFEGATYKVLYQIASRATNDETLFEFLGALHHLLNGLIPAKNLYLCLLSDRPGYLNFPYFMDERDGDSMQEFDVPVRRGLTEYVLRTGSTELISQARYEALRQAGEITQATGDLTFHAWLGVPLQIKGQVGGVLVVQSYDASVIYQPTDTQLLTFVARHVSAAIEKKQSYIALKTAHADLERETLQRRQSEAMYRVFYQLAMRAGGDESLHDFCAKVHELLVELMPAPNCYVCLCDVNKQRKQFLYFKDEQNAHSALQLDAPMQQGLTEWVVTNGRPQRMDPERLAQLQADGLIAPNQSHARFTAWLGVPLNIRGAVDGVLSIHSYAPGAAYTDADAEILAHVAQHVSAAIERKQTYEAIRYSEQRYRNVIEQVDQGMMVLHSERVLFANVRAATMLGTTAQELLQLGWMQHLHPEDREKALHELSELNGGADRTSRQEMRLTAADGSIRWIEMGATCVHWEDALATLAFLSDITPRKQLELALRRTSFEREAMLNTALVGISFNVKERIVWVNDKCVEMSGFKREELIGQSPRVFYDSDESFAAEKAKSDASLLLTGSYNSERNTRRQNGEIICVLLAGRCVEGCDPDAGVIWTLLDVTDRRRAEDDIRQALDRQRELNVLRSRFVAMTSHEFRTPLASILSSAELLRYYSHRVSAEERVELLQSIESGVHRMTLMLDRILLIGKAEAEMLEFKPQPLDLKGLCEELIRDAGTQHPGAHSPIFLDWQINDLPSGYDEKLCRHIFSNLLSNALKYSPSGEKIDMRVSIEQGKTVLVIQDRGIGIPADELHHLFDAFHRASNVGAIAGTGLGLSIVKKSVELHGGTITVNSTVNQGTCFTVVL